MCDRSTSVLNAASGMVRFSVDVELCAFIRAVGTAKEKC